MFYVALASIRLKCERDKSNANNLVETKMHHASQPASQSVVKVLP